MIVVQRDIKLNEVKAMKLSLERELRFVGNMMQCVVLDGNPLDEDDGNLLDEVIHDLMDLVMM